MTPPTLDGDAIELTEKEWREMRRRMTSLQFEPVPETPELLPRSVYGESDLMESADAREHGEENHDVVDAVPYVEAHATSSSPAMALSILDASASLDAVVDVDAPVLSWSSRGERRPLSSSSSPSKVSLSAKALQLTKSHSEPASSVKEPRRFSASTGDDVGATPSASEAAVVDLTQLEATISTAQDKLRLTILTAVHEATTKQEREATLERRKLEAAYTNRVAMLQNQLDELSVQAQAHERLTRSSTQTVDRATRVMMKWKQREREWWRGAHSLQACFHAWQQRWRRKKLQRVQQHFASQFQKKQSQQLAMQQWKLMTQQSTWEQKLQTFQAEHRARSERAAVEHVAAMEELRGELDAAKQKASLSELGRQQLEGDLRQVFLRGVSAMNIEALTLFKANHQLLQQRSQTPPKRETWLEQQQQQEDSECAQRRSRPSCSTRAPAPSGGETSEELPSEERMIPIKVPTELSKDPRVKMQSLLPTAVTTTTTPNATAAMPSSAIANRLLKHAGSAEIPSQSEYSVPVAEPPTGALHALRSAELVEAHHRLLHTTSSRQPSASDLRPTSLNSSSGRSLSPPKQHVKVRSSTEFNVEMQFVRSTVTSAAALSARYPVKHATSAPPMAKSKWRK